MVPHHQCQSDTRYARMAQQYNITLNSKALAAGTRVAIPRGVMHKTAPRTHFEELSDFGLNLRVARIKKRMRQLDVALKADVSTTWISMFENGQRKPTRDEIRRICSVLGVEPTDLGANN